MNEPGSGLPRIDFNVICYARFLIGIEFAFILVRSPEQPKKRRLDFFPINLERKYGTDDEGNEDLKGVAPGSRIEISKGFGWR